MIALVSRHSPRIFAGTIVGGERRHVDSFGQRFAGDNQLRNNYSHCFPPDLLVHVHRETPVPAADRFDCSEPAHKGVWHCEHVHQFRHVLHLGLLLAPREERPLKACSAGSATGLTNHYASAVPHRFPKVNIDYNLLTVVAS